MAARRPSKTPLVPATSFADLGVPGRLVAALEQAGISTPFPIQAATLPDSLAGRDVLGRGRTGSGKTYAFALPVLARLSAATSPRLPGRPRSLILAPTRELATQIEATIAPLATALSLRTLTIFGGVSARPQVGALRAGVDILIACPGRLADHVSTGDAILDAVEVTVLDEADHMADLGFLPAVRRLLDRTPPRSQRLLFSATLDAGVDVLVRRYLSNPVTHSVDSAMSPVAAMTHHVLRVRHDDRLPVLIDLTAAPGRTLVFTRTKRGAKKLTSQLVASGVPAVELHGNLAQNARTRNLAAFSAGDARALVATDIAARGIHVDDVALVIHADPPAEHKAYLHRSGRTARAGASGTVVTLMTDDQVTDVRDLTRQAGINPTITRLGPGDSLLTELAPGERRFVTPPLAATAPHQGRAHSATRRPDPRTAAGGSTVSAARGRGSERRASAAETTSVPRGAAAFSSSTRVGSRRGQR
ncbi:DEAD/DEAH box helicase [Micromonospora sp. DR5-3]|uniref:DEAD/DEAH box helicase n=1 Tax=unclassified Micromonospora TaxID=2617518 RepID=UPI0011D653B6|nr:MULTISPECIES: DEAD/DEAH box helicase [unclassified Micromonospora]MCW3820667.1 DEAD/DEAH box helicase [Micromonospora sp. DR5-3]TYC12915.1 DEAD/DEAH box helicase [Micromonospora sp. MP36]